MPTRTPLDESAVFTDVLTDLPVAKAATTSRVVFSNELMRHVVFVFDAGQVLTEHSSPRAVVVTLLSGAMRFQVAGVDHTLTAGDVVYLAPGESHALEALEQCHMGLTLVVADASKADDD